MVDFANKLITTSAKETKDWKLKASKINIDEISELLSGFFDFKYLKQFKCMKLKKAIKILKNHNKWRLGAETDMIKPIIITTAINKVIKNYDKYNK